MKQSIYNIEQQYLQLAEQIIESGGEVTEEQEQALAINKQDLQVKAVNYGYVIMDIENDMVAIDAEIKRLQELKSVRSNLITKLKDTVHKAMTMYDIDEIKLNNLKINFRKSTSVEIYDESKIPDEYRTTKEVTTISKKDIGEALKKGFEVEGAHLSHNKNLQIK